VNGVPTRLVTILIAVCAPCLSAAAADSITCPNIVLILADDLGYGELGCYGQKRIRTPHLDRMAREGIRFTDAYAGSTVCAPSRCVLMTGLHTGHCFIRGNARDNLRPHDLTVAEVLKRAGYATGLVGKWGLGHEGSTGVPTRKGFDAFFGYLDQHHAHNYYPAFLMRNESPIRLRNYVPGDGPWGDGVATKKVDYSHDLLMTEASAFLDRHRNQRFFLFLSITLPHVNNELFRKTKNGFEVPDYGPYEQTDWPEQQKGRAAMIHRVDECVGKVLERLKSLGLDEHTLVFFSSDNGPQHEGGSDLEFFDSNGPLRGGKRDLYEGGIRVPTLVRWPGRVPAGKTSNFTWGFWDFLPTVAELAGVSTPQIGDGISIAPVLFGHELSIDRIMYWEFHERGFSQAARWGNWKAVRNRSVSAPLELYDLCVDLSERCDVACRHRNVVRRIETFLATARTESKEYPVRNR
jgi:arylsulfatase A-like enzyme